MFIKERKVIIVVAIQKDNESGCRLVSDVTGTDWLWPVAIRCQSSDCAFLICYPARVVAFNLMQFFNEMLFWRAKTTAMTNNALAATSRLLVL